MTVQPFCYLHWAIADVVDRLTDVNNGRSAERVLWMAHALQGVI